jgi:YesN/AraC family two-component response regulator
VCVRALRQWLGYTQAGVVEEVKSQAKKDEDAAKEEAEAEQKSSIAKTEAAEAAMADGEVISIDGQEVKVKSQKVITLKDSMEERDRKDLYKNYLLYCMSGDQVDLPMGSSVVIERDQTEFLRLAQLGDVLGLTQLDVADVHKGLAEQAFRTNVQQVRWRPTEGLPCLAVTVPSWQAGAASAPV